MTDHPRPARADARLAELFPDEGSADASPSRRRRRTAAVAGALVVLVVIGVVVATAAFGSSGPDYRLATVGPEQVDSVLTSVATIEPIAQATVAFPVSGKVASVNVKVGDAVTAGGVLASLDTQSLQDTLHTKQNSLAQAQLTLSKALSGQSVGGVGSGSSFGSSSGNGASAITSSYHSSGSAAAIVLTNAPISDPTLTADQQAVLTAQQAVDAASTAAGAAVDALTNACLSSDPSTPPDATACQQAITAVQTAQKNLSDAQSTLATASNTLDTYLTQLASNPPSGGTGGSGNGGGSGNSGGSGNGAPSGNGATSGDGGSGQTGGPGDGAPSGDAGSTGGNGTAAGSAGGTGSFGGSSSGGASGAGGSSRSTGSTASGPTAADLVAYQAAVDAAADAVSAAQQAVDAATIASPLTGTVVGVNMKVGDSVSAGSSTENIVVEGQGGYEISTSVSVDDIPSVSIGQTATVLPDGSHQPLDGKVVGISVVPAGSTSSSTLYHVIVGLTNPDAPLHDGATGTVSIVTKQSHAALAVPTSALTTTVDRHTVTVMRDGDPTTVVVQTGVIGAEWAEITSGLKAGDRVVLADTSAALPGSATASSSSGSGLGTPFGPGGAGGFGGFGGFGGAGGRAVTAGRG